MKIWRNLIITLFISLLIQSCGIGYYKVRNELRGNTKQTINNKCVVKYSLILSGYNGYRKIILDQIQSDHTLFTKEVFNEYGCDAQYVENELDANFAVEIKRPLFLGASALDYLSAFSFGLIPSWGTEETNIFLFYNKKINLKNIYYVDTRHYSHLVFLPFSWTMFITLNEEKIFKKSLRNFIENS